jgi:biopolymer transport protein ExbB
MINRGAAFFLLMCIPAIASAWWNDEWNFRKQISIDTGATGAGLTESVEETPVLVRLHTGNFGYFLDMLKDGSDLRFVAADDKTPLKFHIETFDPINEMALVWVKIPRLVAGTNTDKIWMYYGNSAAKGGHDAAGTYDVNQVLVYHFDALSAGPVDRTAYGNNPASSNALANPASHIGAGVQFGDAGKRVTIAASPSMRLIPSHGWTFSAWVKPTDVQSNMVVMESHDGDRLLRLGIDSGVVYSSYQGNGMSFETARTAVLNPGVWSHLAVVVKDSSLILYVNGEAVATGNGAMMEMSANILLGGAADSASFTGEMDEVQISNTARSAAWLRAAVRSQGSESAMLAYGGDEQNQNAGGGTSYFGVILQNVTVDGWVVIFILGIMAAISWVVMLGKGLLIQRARKDDAEFLRQFRELGAADPGKLDQKESEEERELQGSPVSQALFGKHDHFQSSTLYHIYHTGIHEVNARLGKAAGAQATGLSTQAINTIRAALDATLVRETQKLTNQMVMLTIAISGGPFLGLLGTVVGVMITFAAIAASGDVNINAIAPGIAAALVATVAGLAVAIPALFGYNYLNTRIKDAVADMHVFVDEYIAKIAEHYGK